MSKQLTDLLVKNRLFRHLAFWLVFLLVSSTFYYIYFQRVNNLPHHDIVVITLVRSLYQLPVIVVAAYLLVYYQIPKFIYRQDYLSFIVHFLISAYFLSVIMRILNIYVYEPFIKVGYFRQEPIDEILSDALSLFKGYFFRVYTTPFILVMLKLIKDRFTEQQRQQKLEKEKLSAELNFLRAQIHPHFLFNTLNNLYLLTLKKSDKAPETVIKLSEIMDYMIYQCNEPYVPLEKELKLIDNYIGLEMLRYGARLDLSFDKDIDDSQKRIAPLLLLSLVENAFKHGVSGDIGDPIIEIGLIVVGDSLHFRVYNTKSNIIQKDERNYKKGIGISNTKRQLELTYPDQHRITIEEEEWSYTVNLFIDLNTEKDED